MKASKVNVHAKGQPRYPYGIRKANARKGKNKSEPGTNQGRSAFSVHCPTRGCKRSAAEGGRNPDNSIYCSVDARGIVCPECRTPIPTSAYA